MNRPIFRRAQRRSGPRELSTAGRVVLAITILISLSIVGRAAIDLYGFPYFGYRGRGNLIFAEMSETLDISIANRRRAIALWLNRCEDDARSIVSMLRDASALPGQGGSGTAPAWEAEAAGLLSAGLAKNPAYREILLIDPSSGRVILSTSRIPSLAAIEARHFEKGSQPFFIPNVGLLFPFASDEARAKAIWLCLVIDPQVFFRQVVSAGAADAADVAGLDWAMIGSEGRVIATNEALQFPMSSPVLPTASLRTLYSRGFARVLDGQGKIVVVKLSDPLPMIEGGNRLVASADRMMLEGPLRSEAAASLVLNVLFGLFSVTFTWLALRRVFLPYRHLVEAVVTFAEGGNPILPAPAKGEIGYLIGAFGDLIARVSEQRKTLEREVESRTSDLSMMNTATRALALSAEDDRAYQSMLAALRDGLGAETGLVVYFTGNNEARALSPEGGPPLELNQQRLAEVELASKTAGGRALVLGEEYGGCVGARLAIDGDLVGYILIGRRAGFFRPREVEAISRALKDMAPLVYERRERSRQEETRTAAERELRRSEERLRSFFEESRDMIYTANGDDTIAWINDAGIELLGLSDRFDAVGRKFSEFALSVEDREIFLEELRNRGFARDYEIVLKKADGSPIFCIETANSIKTGDGSVTEIQGIIKDISERINKEKEILRANLELNRANTRLQETQMLVVQREKLASIGQLSAGIAHEINNPLGFLKSNHEVLQGFLGKLQAAWEESSVRSPSSNEEIARRFDLDYVFRQAAEIMRESNDGYHRIVEIVKNLRNFARADSDTAFSEYDVEDGVRSTLIVARNAIKYVATVELALGGVPHVSASAGEINQVLLNIVMNAAQAIEGQRRDSQGLIRIATLLGDGRVVVSVDDDGPGIPEKLRLRVFDPFFTTKEPGKGTGLGLSISYDIIVNKHGGRLTVGDSSLGGASFRIELPILPSPLKTTEDGDPGPASP